MRLREEIEEGLNHPTHKFQNTENADVEKNQRIIAEILLDIRELLEAKEEDEEETTYKWTSDPGITYYVDLHGDDKNDGKSVKTSFKTLAHAETIARPGIDKIRIRY